MVYGLVLWMQMYLFTMAKPQGIAQKLQIPSTCRSPWYSWLVYILILLVYTLVLKVHYLMYMGIVPCSGFLIHPPIMIPHDCERKLPDITTTNHYYHSNFTVIENSHKDTKTRDGKITMVVREKTERGITQWNPLKWTPLGPPLHVWNMEAFVIGASLSEPHTSGTALWKCVNIHTSLLACGHIP